MTLLLRKEKLKSVYENRKKRPDALLKKKNVGGDVEMITLEIVVEVLEETIAAEIREASTGSGEIILRTTRIGATTEKKETTGTIETGATTTGTVEIGAIPKTRENAETTPPTGGTPRPPRQRAGEIP